uniref:Uncharacterized protein n=1 Tax=Anguilla anguilla TaxID=7936 RepID=A0A0E9TTT7_ANGAN
MRRGWILEIVQSHSASHCGTYCRSAYNPGQHRSSNISQFVST